MGKHRAAVLAGQVLVAVVLAGCFASTSPDIPGGAPLDCRANEGPATDVQPGVETTNLTIHVLNGYDESPLKRISVYAFWNGTPYSGPFHTYKRPPVGEPTVWELTHEAAALLPCTLAIGTTDASGQVHLKVRPGPITLASARLPYGPQTTDDRTPTEVINTQIADPITEVTLHVFPRTRYFIEGEISGLDPQDETNQEVVIPFIDKSETELLRRLVACADGNRPHVSYDLYWNNTQTSYAGLSTSLFTGDGKFLSTNPAGNKTGPGPQMFEGDWLGMSVESLARATSSGIVILVRDFDEMVAVTPLHFRIVVEVTVASFCVDQGGVVPSPN